MELHYDQNRQTMVPESELNGLGFVNRVAPVEQTDASSHEASAVHSEDKSNNGEVRVVAVPVEVIQPEDFPAT
ncbi:hypothetical protein HY441_00605 [Candidatus Microgenomates bacterium]|nr:hypothetical protein [Candidatus Microgenomates bacterium]